MTRATQPARPISLRKKLIFAAIVSGASLLLIEGACRLFLAYRPRKTVQFQVADGSVETDWLDILNQDLDVTDPDVRLYAEDRALYWKLRPNTQATVANLVYRTRGEPVSWSVTINANGFRGKPYPTNESASPIVICLGDSCTFGFRVSDDETYPAQLRGYLRQHVSPESEVVNYGVPGYTTYQGRLLLDRILSQHTPDVVVLGFGANDLEQDRLSDAEKATRQRLPLVETPQGFERLAVVRLLRGRPRGRRTEIAGGDTQTRVSLTEYRDNLEHMVRVARQKGCQVVLLDLVFVSPQYRDTIADVAARNDLSWLDGRCAMREALDDLLAARRFQQEKQAIDQFWYNEVVGFRAVYYSEQFYEQLFADEVWSQMLKYLMVEPVHANPLGNKVLAERIGSIIATSGKWNAH